MFAPTAWGDRPPAIKSALVPWLTDTGSLTERLMRTGKVFSVTLLLQGLTPASEDEAALIDASPGEPVMSRHVTLALEGRPVVVARSIARQRALPWRAILDRGNSPLGLTLFGGNPGIIRAPLLYSEISEGNTLFSLARQHDPAAAHRYPARRSNFRLEGEVLNVCEIFLPALEDFL